MGSRCDTAGRAQDASGRRTALDGGRLAPTETVIDQSVVAPTDYLENCCHIVAQISSTAAAIRALCGRELRGPTHRTPLLIYTCPSCGRARCPECVVLYERGAR